MYSKRVRKKRPPIRSLQPKRDAADAREFYYFHVSPEIDCWRPSEFNYKSWRDERAGTSSLTAWKWSHVRRSRSQKQWNGIECVRSQNGEADEWFLIGTFRSTWIHKMSVGLGQIVSRETNWVTCPTVNSFAQSWATAIHWQYRWMSRNAFAYRWQTFQRYNVIVAEGTLNGTHAPSCHFYKR